MTQRRQSVIMSAPDPKGTAKSAAQGLKDEIRKLKELVKAAGVDVKDAQRTEQDLKNQLLGLETRLKALTSKSAPGG
jgi:hypothetical protein